MSIQTKNDTKIYRKKKKYCPNGCLSQMYISRISRRKTQLQREQNNRASYRIHVIQLSVGGASLLNIKHKSSIEWYLIAHSSTVEHTVRKKKFAHLA